MSFIRPQRTRGIRLTVVAISAKRVKAPFGVVLALTMGLASNAAALERIASANEVRVPIAGIFQVAPSDSVTWDRTVAQLLEQRLWENATAYDASHFLMVPLHAAFISGNLRWQSGFDAQFSRFATAGVTPSRDPKTELNRLQYDFLASRFAVLAIKAGRSTPANLVSILGDQLAATWSHDTAWAWGKPFPGGVRERLAWKLSPARKAHGYFGAVDDVERYLFAIAADLRSIERLTGRALPQSSAIEEILAAAQRTFETRGKFQADGGWLFQPGVWSDYRDYLYAGQSRKVIGMPPAPVRDIAEDASHSFRMPLILRSLAEAYSVGDPQRFAYDAMRQGLAKQFLQHVLVAPSSQFPGYRTTNFMDGTNGVYRWQYLNRGPDWGFGPYELSSSLTLGWWTFTDNAKVKEVYRFMAKTLPTSEVVQRFYTGSARVADSRDPRFIIRDSYANGLRELVVTLAGMI